MKKEIIIKTVTTSLALANFVQDFNTYLNTAEDIFFRPSTESVVFDKKSKYPIITNGYPSLEDDDTEEMEMDIFQSGFYHYNYEIITVIIIAPNITYAEQLATNFKSKLDSQITEEFRNSGQWNMHVKPDSISTAEVLEIGTKAEIIYTIMPGSLI